MLTSLAPFVNIQFLGSSLTFMMVYVWGRRHQYVQLNFLGLFNFTAPYLPWVLLAFSVMLGSSPVVDLMGMAAGGCRVGVLLEEWKSAGCGHCDSSVVGSWQCQLLWAVSHCCWAAQQGQRWLPPQQATYLVPIRAL
jgi:hypothetical protein